MSDAPNIVADDKTERDRKQLRINNQSKNAFGLPDVTEFPVLTKEELMKLRIAQVSPEKCAAYFGKTKDDFMVAVDSDIELKKVFDVGPDRGKAMIQEKQFTSALAGDVNSLKHFGEHHLGQKTKVEHGVDEVAFKRFIEAAEAKIGQSAVARLRQEASDEVDQKYIEGEFEEVEDDKN